MDLSTWAEALEGLDPRKPQTVAIVGSRGYPHRDFVEGFVKHLPAGWTVVSGGAAGVDTWAISMAARVGLGARVVEPDWETHGKAAGPIRNREIVSRADWVVAFWDGQSKGTANTIQLAEKAGKLRGIYRA